MTRSTISTVDPFGIASHIPCTAASSPLSIGVNAVPIEMIIGGMTSSPAVAQTGSFLAPHTASRISPGMITGTRRRAANGWSAVIAGR